MSEPPATQSLAARIEELRGLDSVHDCRIRLMSVRTRIETNWPSKRGFLRRGPALDRESQATIANLLAALPCPLPLEAGGEPVPLIGAGETDLQAAAGRAVDAAMALLAGAELDTLYHGDVTLLESYEPGAAEPITVSDPSVGLLVATIIGTLEAIVEQIGPGPRPGARAASNPPRPSRQGPDTHKGRRDVRRP
ncbi:MAG: hypothetical protein ABSE70_08560 [Candidatus Limnocylindrales bacterium]